MSKPSLAENLKKNLSRRNFSLKTLTAIVLFGLIIVVFIFFGYSGQNAGGGMGAAARVNNSFISVNDVNQKAQELEQMYAGMFGGNFGEQQRQYLLAQALESMIQGELLSQNADKNGIYATDREVQQTITTELPYFQDNGSFRFEKYRGILEANRLTPAEFEDRIRKDKKTQRLKQLFEISSTPFLAEVQQLKELEETQFNFQYVKIERARLVDQMTVSPKEIQDRLANPEFKKRVADDFAANEKTYDQEEQVKAQHILIKADPTTDKAALAKIEGLRNRAAKEDFGKLAAEFSDDAGSKKNKGDLGYFGRGRMVPEFDNAAFSQGVGVVGAPVKTQFGYHIIKVTDKKPAVKGELAKVETQIAKRMIAEEKFEADVKKFEDAVAANNNSEIEKSMKALGAKWQETGYIAIGMDQIPAFASPVASQAAFELSSTKPVSKIVRDGNVRFLIKFKDKTVKPAAKPTEPDSLARERGYERLNSWVQLLTKDAHIERKIHGPPMPGTM